MTQLKPRDIKPLREKLLEEQKGKCALCGRACSFPTLDHDHTSGVVRSVLCAGCNRAEGKISHWAGSTGVLKVNFVKRLLAYWGYHWKYPREEIHPTHGKKRRRRKRK